MTVTGTQENDTETRRTRPSILLHFHHDFPNIKLCTDDANRVRIQEKGKEEYLNVLYVTFISKESEGWKEKSAINDNDGTNDDDGLLQDLAFALKNSSLQFCEDDSKWLIRVTIYINDDYDHLSVNISTEKEIEGSPMILGLDLLDVDPTQQIGTQTVTLMKDFSMLDDTVNLTFSTLVEIQKTVKLRDINLFLFVGLF